MNTCPCRLALFALALCAAFSPAAPAPASAAQPGMTTEIIDVYWIPAETLAELLRPFLSPQGSVVADPVSNVLIVTDHPGNMGQLRAMAIRFDVTQPQVRITARLVKASQSFLTGAGVNWGQGAPFGPGYSAVVIHDSMATVDARVQARQNSGHARTDSQLTVTTLALEHAELSLGSSLPIPGGHGATDYRDVLVRLAVTPRVLNDNRLRLALEVTAESTANPLQGIDVSAASTTVDVNEGETVAIGSSNTTTDTGRGSGAAGLDAIPLLGYAFTTRHSGGGRQSLVIFVSAEIL